MSPQPHDLQLVPDDDTNPYFVVGGRYAHTSFTTLTNADPASGPFDTYQGAFEAWRAASMQHVDEAFVRYLVVQAATPEDAQTHAEESAEGRDTRIA